MDKDKSILEKFTDTVKDIANSASEALKAEEPPKVEQSNAAYMPLAAEGLVSDPLLVPPIDARLPRRKSARKTAKKAPARKATAKRAVPKKARKAAKQSARARSKGTARSSAKRTTRSTNKRTTKRSARKRSRR
jgi:hypothetical protein